MVARSSTATGVALSRGGSYIKFGRAASDAMVDDGCVLPFNPAMAGAAVPRAAEVWWWGARRLQRRERRQRKASDRRRPRRHDSAARPDGMTKKGARSS